LHDLVALEEVTSGRLVRALVPGEQSLRCCLGREPLLDRLELPCERVDLSLLSIDADLKVRLGRVVRHIRGCLFRLPRACRLADVVDQLVAIGPELKLHGGSDRAASLDVFDARRQREGPDAQPHRGDDRRGDAHLQRFANRKLLGDADHCDSQPCAEDEHGPTRELQPGQCVPVSRVDQGAEELLLHQPPGKKHERHSAASDDQPSPAACRRLAAHVVSVDLDDPLGHQERRNDDGDWQADRKKDSDCLSPPIPPNGRSICGRTSGTPLGARCQLSDRPGGVAASAGSVTVPGCRASGSTTPSTSPPGSSPPAATCGRSPADDLLVQASCTPDPDCRHHELETPLLHS
jgi:hypothetical protein